MATYDAFATKYDEMVGDTGDYFHRTQIDPYILQIIGDVKGKTLYDLGCGNGYLSRKFAREGATVFASDTSFKLIDIAKNKSKNSTIAYSNHDALDFSLYQAKQFDIVMMNMVIQYIKDLPTLFKGIVRVLKPNGVFVCSLNHIFRPPHPYSEWIQGKIGSKDALFIKTTNYLGKREKKVVSGWDNQTEMILYSHTLGDLINSMSANNLYLYELHEPESVGFAKGFKEDLLQKAHIPTFMIFGARKIG
jgi:ubiquinone/menaquinone biosynthesis C-methylase UbiE